MGDDQSDRAKFVVGLGNPGRRYERTRHNVGFRVVDVLADRWLAGAPREAFGGLVWLVRPDQQRPVRVMLLKPQTYMNRSGRAVRELVGFHKGACEDVLVILDDCNLPLGRLRARAEGSAGGHNGLADVQAALGTRQVPRLRVGIGAPPGLMGRTDFVLARFTADQAQLVETAIRRAADAAACWVRNGMETMMNEYNRTEESQCS